MQISEAVGGAPAPGAEPCRFPKLEECAHFHYERVQLPQLSVTLQTNMDQSLYSQHTNEDESCEWHMVQVSSADECWLVQRSYDNFVMLDAQLHQCIYDRKISQLPDLSSHSVNGEDIEALLMSYLERFSNIVDNSVNCGPVLNWFQMDNKGHRLLVPSEESRSINTPAVAAAYSVRRYVSQARDELNLEVGDMISVIDMASPAESVWWRGKRGFQVGFFPQHCVHIIGDKVPRNMPLPPPIVGSLALSPVKPVLRKHGKLIAFFRSFILNRPSRRRLKQSGILKERVFGCDLGEHLLNSGHSIPMVLKCCAEFIEKHGIVDGIYRLSGVTSNIQKLRNAFDEDRIPDLYTEDILQDIHSVASLLKMYFRELPNPLCTYQLYQSFVNAVQGCNNINRNSINDHERLLKMREAVQKLPPPHYRTLEYLMRHLARVAKHGANTGMTTRNVAIVWAPNLLRCAELEVGGVAALQGVGVQAVVTEFLICYADLIFCDHLPNLNSSGVDMDSLLSPKRCRPKSLAISTPTKLITLEEARSKHLLSKSDESGYIEVGGGPSNLPTKYHTIIELPAGTRKRGFSKRSPSVWRSFFSRSRNSSQGSLNKNRKASTPGIIIAEKSVTESDLTDMKRKLRPVKSAESLTSGHSEPALGEDVLGPLHCLLKPPGHNRSVSHDSYFDTLQNSQNNSEGSLLDLSEIQLNFELEESEMRIFSEDESLVSSPRVRKDPVHRKIFTRARPEDASSINNSANPSPKKQARVVLSPDSSSRKRTRLEDQLSDIQYIDCITPDNTYMISTTALVHSQPETTKAIGFRCFESYQPKNKSPRNSEVDVKRQSLNLDKSEKPSLPKSLTESNISGQLVLPSDQSSAFATPTPQSPTYKPLGDSSTTTTPLSPDFSPPTEIGYQNLNRCSGDNEKTLQFDKSVYEDVVSPVSKKASPTYENVLTTISITYRSPTKSNKEPIVPENHSESIYEDVLVNPEQALVPTVAASLPLQQASQPDLEDEEEEIGNISSTFLPLLEKEIRNQRPRSLSALEDNNPSNDGSNESPRPNSSFGAVSTAKHESKSTDLQVSDTSELGPILSETLTPYNFVNSAEQLSPTDLSLSEVLHSSTDNLSTSQSSISFPVSPVRNSTSPNVSPMQFGENTKTLSQEILTPISPSLSPLDSRTRDTSEGSLVALTDDNGFNPLAIRPCNPEYFKLTDNNISPSDFSMSEVEKSKMEKSSELTSAVSENIVHKTSIEIRPVELNFDNRPTSINLIEFSPSEPSDLNPNRALANDKRKSSETECLDDENSIYQQVKYFRRSIHEINALLDMENVPPNENTNGSRSNSLQNLLNNLESNNSIKETDILSDDPSESKNYDSLEAETFHVYENVETNPQGIDEIKENTTESSSGKITETESENSRKNSSERETLAKLNVKSLTSKFELKPMSEKPPIFKQNDQKSPGIPKQNMKPFDFQNRCSVNVAKNKFGSNSSLESNVSNGTPKVPNEKEKLSPCLQTRQGSASSNEFFNSSKSKFGSTVSLESDLNKQKIVYDKDGLPPCLRAKQIRNTVKTRSLDEDAFSKEFGMSQSLPRRKSMDENLGSKLNTLPKVLNQPKPLPSEDEKLDIHLTHSTENVGLTLPEQKLNRERIEKYKEERRKFLHDKYRSESFKENKDILLTRFKQKTPKDKENEDEANSNGEQKGTISDAHLDAVYLKLGARRKNSCGENKDSLSEESSSEFTKDSLENNDVNTRNSLSENDKSTCKKEIKSDLRNHRIIESKPETHRTKYPSDCSDSIKSRTALFESHLNQSRRSASDISTSKFVDLKVNKNSGVDPNNKVFKNVQEYKSPVYTKKNINLKELDSDVSDIAGGEDFIRNKRRDDDGNKSERRRHTYESRERETEGDRVRRVSLESRSPRKEKRAPAYCIKDMKAIFESKSQQ